MALITSGFGGDDTPPKPAQKGGPVKRYEVEINGVRTTLQLTDADAKARGLEKPPTAQAKAKTPANKAKTPANKQAAAPADKSGDAGS